MPARPVDSEIVAALAPCNTKCSVVIIDNAAAGGSDLVATVPASSELASMEGNILSHLEAIPSSH
jgi:hypothetical protein